MIQERINSLQQLLEALPHCSGKQYVDIVDGMELDVAEFKPYSFWNEQFYTRNCIARSDKYELILLCWEPGQITPIHCHGGQECWVYMVQGCIGETRYDLDEATQKLTESKYMELGEGKFSYMNDDMGLHSLKNLSDGRSMSLHLYMNPIDECRIYDDATGDINYRKLQYHSIEGNYLS